MENKPESCPLNSSAEMLACLLQVFGPAAEYARQVLWSAVILGSGSALPQELSVFRQLVALCSFHTGADELMNETLLILKRTPGIHLSRRNWLIIHWRHPYLYRECVLTWRCQARAATGGEGQKRERKRGWRRGEGWEGKEEEVREMFPCYIQMLHCLPKQPSLWVALRVPA